MTRKPNQLHILQIDPKLVSFVRCRPSAKGLEAEAPSIEPIHPDGNEEALAEALSGFAKRHDLASAPVYTVLPRHNMTARILVLPSHDSEEIGRMIRLTAEEYVPFPLHELIIDHSILDKMPDGYARVLAVYAQRSVAEQHVELLRKAGIEPAGIFVSTACLASAALAALHDEPERWALVNLGAGGLEVLVFRAGRLEYNRGIPTAQDWSMQGEAAADAAEELGAEVRASLSAFKRESEDGLGVDRVYVSSDGMDIRAACKALDDALDIECMPAPFASRLLEHANEPEAACPLSSLGAALGAQGRGAVHISLVPESLKRSRQAVQTRRKLMQATGLIAAVIVAAGAWYWLAVNQREAYLAELQARLSEIRPQAQALIDKQRQLLILQNVLDRSGSALELLAKTVALAPDGVNINTFSYRKDEGLTINGRAKTRNLVDTYAEQLRQAGIEDMPLLRNAQVGPTSSEIENKQEVLAYEIQIPFPEEAIEPEAGVEMEQDISI